MKQCDQRPKRGRGTGYPHETPFCGIKYRRDEKGLNRGETGNHSFTRPPSPSAPLPRGIMPASDPVIVTAHLRYMATSRPAIQLNREQRQAAAADPTLEWDASIHGYRRKHRT